MHTIQRVLAFSVFGFVFAFSLPAAAWDYPGHRVVGAIADLVLKQHHPKAYAAIGNLLATTGPDGVVVTRSLSQAAVFADCAKPGNEPFCGRPSSEEEKAYALRNKHHRDFHFTDVPLQQSQYRFGGAGTGKIDVVHMINYAVAQLRAKTPAEKPQKIDDVDLTDSEAVWLLAHLVGDIHQPLHVGAKFYDTTCETSVDPNDNGPNNNFGIGTSVAETVGGNFILLDAPAPIVPPNQNFHYYWDGNTVLNAMRSAGLAHSEQDFAKLLAVAPPSTATWKTAGGVDGWAQQWATEVMPLAVEAHGRLQIKKGQRPPPFPGHGNCTWTATIDPAYEDWASQRAREQLAKAGFRLAALLAAIFEP